MDKLKKYFIYIFRKTVDKQENMSYNNLRCRFNTGTCDSSTVGSTPPCQGGGRGFESRLSL